MLDWTGSRLPSLAHPSYPSRQRNRGQVVPAFPEIRSDWEGFCLSHMHCVGLHRSVSNRTDADTNNSRRIEHVLPLYHELFGHFFLSHSLKSKWRRVMTLELLEDIMLLSCGLERVRTTDHDSPQMPIRALRHPVLVPVVPASSAEASSIEFGWLNILLASKDAMAFEEAFAVWASITKAEQHGILSSSARPQYERAYKERYGRVIPKFGDFYDLFSIMTTDAHYDAAALIGTHILNLPVRTDVSVLSTFTVSVLMSCVGVSVNDMYDDKMESEHDLLTDSFMHAYSRLSQPKKRVVDLLLCDQELPLYEGPMRQIEELVSDERQPRGFWLRPPDLPIFCNFDAGGLKRDGSFVGNPAHHPSDSLFDLESIRQQLTQGKGLRCPAWGGTHCCGRMRDILEGVWEHTVAREGFQEQWKREGCLKK